MGLAPSPSAPDSFRGVETRLAASRAADRFAIRIDAKERIPRLLRNRVPVEGQSLRLPRSKFSLTLKGDEERNKDEERYHHDN